MDWLAGAVPTGPADGGTRRAWLPAVVAAVAFAALAAWSWRRWPDPLIDFGRELYVAGQLLEGRLLYRDVASLFGPLSPYVNALWFRLFGASLLTLALCNLAILALLAWAIYSVIRPPTDRLTATTATLVFLLVFGFAQYVTVGNYNFVTPYSHEITHGMLLATLMILMLGRGLASASTALTGMAGLCFGLVALTKPEVTIAAGAAAAAGLIAYAAVSRPAFMALTRAVALFAGLAVGPPLAFFLLFARHLGTRGAAAILTAPLSGIATSGISATRYYRAGAGLDDPGANLLLMFGMSAIIGGFAAILAAVALLSSRLPAVGSAPAALRIGTRALAVVGPGLWASWVLLPRGLPVTTAAILTAIVGVMYGKRTSPRAALHYLPLLCWCTFALALLPKMLLNVRLSHYGFALAMPATLTLVVGLVWLVPAIVGQAGGSGHQCRVLALLAIGTAVTVHVGTSHALLRAKTFVVGDGANRFLAFDGPIRWQGRATAEAVALIERTLGRDDTLAVMPQGAMINVLTRRHNPTPYHTLMPPELRILGEARILAAYRGQPPEYVLLVSTETREYGVGRFGSATYGEALGSWIARCYESVGLVGRDELGHPGMDLLKRRSPGGPAPASCGENPATRHVHR